MAPGLSHAVRGGERAVKRDSLTRPPRDETRTAYILQAVESAWEGVDRKKATRARDSATAENPNGVGAEAEVLSGPSSLPQEEEVCDGWDWPGQRETSLLCSREEKGLFWG